MLFSITLLLSVTFAGAQTQNGLPEDLPGLVRSLPQLVHTKQFQFGPFSDVVDAALKRDPASMADAIPACAQNLRNTDPDVRNYTLAMLVAFTVQPGGRELIQPLGPEIANILISDGDSGKRMAIGLVSILGPKAPDDVIEPLEKLMQTRHDSERLTVGAAQALMLARPLDDSTQSEVLALMNDPNTSRQMRITLINATGVWGVGPRIIENVVQLINRSDDKELRDTAIAAARQIGPPAVNLVRDRLRQIEHDPSESPDSRAEAAQALSAAPANETYPMINGKPTPSND